MNTVVLFGNGSKWILKRIGKKNFILNYIYNVRTKIRSNHWLTKNSEWNFYTSNDVDTVFKWLDAIESVFGCLMNVKNPSYLVEWEKMKFDFISFTFFDPRDFSAAQFLECYRCFLLSTYFHNFLVPYYWVGNTNTNEIASPWMLLIQKLHSFIVV